ncbi:MAG: hypothetical protein P8X55_06650 [Desulfosarcinaceae bacterium]
MGSSVFFLLAEADLFTLLGRFLLESGAADILRLSGKDRRSVGHELSICVPNGQGGSFLFCFQQDIFNIRSWRDICF